MYIVCVCKEKKRFVLVCLCSSNFYKVVFSVLKYSLFMCFFVRIYFIDKYDYCNKKVVHIPIHNAKTQDRKTHF